LFPPRSSARWEGESPFSLSSSSSFALKTPFGVQNALSSSLCWGRYNVFLVKNQSQYSSIRPPVSFDSFLRFSVTNRLAQMPPQNFPFPIHVRDRSCHLEKPVVSSYAERQMGIHVLHQFFRCAVQTAEAADALRVQI